MRDPQGAGNRQSRLGTYRRVFGCVMMLEGQTEMTGQDVELMRSEVRPNPLRHLHRAKIGKFGVTLPVDVETRAPDAKIKGGIMGNHGGAGKIIGKLVHDLGKLTGVLHLLRADTVNGNIEGGKAHVPWTDKPLLYPNNPAVLDPGQSHRTSATTLFIGSFKIDGNGLQYGTPVGLLRLLAAGG